MHDPLQVFRKQGFEVFENILDKDELSYFKPVVMRSCPNLLMMADKGISTKLVLDHHDVS